MPTNTDRSTKPPPLDSEIGSAVTWNDSLFLDMLDPTTGAVPYWEAEDYANMLRSDGQARKVEQVLTLPLVSTEYEIEAAKGDKGEAEAITDLLTRPANAGGMTTPLRTVLAQMCTALTFRVASFEKVFTRMGPVLGESGPSRVGYGKLAFRPATSTRVVRDRRSGGYRGLEQDPLDTAYSTRGPRAGLPLRIPAHRAFTYTHGQWREPILGVSEMEVALTVWRTKQKLRFLWFLFLEARALPKVTTEAVGETGSEDSTRSAASKIASLRGGGVVGLPPGVSTNVLESAGQAAEYYKQAMDYLDSEMTASVLAQFTDLASAANSGTGSYALSRDQSDLFLQSREGVLRDMEEQFTAYVIADLVRYNFGATAAVPRLKFAQMDQASLETILTNLATMAPIQAIPAEFTSFLIETAATLMHVPTDRIAKMVKQAEEQAERAARNADQLAMAKIAGPVAGVANAVKGSEVGKAVSSKLAQKSGTPETGRDGRPLTGANAARRTASVQSKQARATAKKRAEKAAQAKEPPTSTSTSKPEQPKK